jgi:cobalt-zinc-cadmium efflux system protein
MPHPSHQHTHHHADREHSHAGHGHHHAPANYTRAFVIGLGLNISFVLIEFIFGALANSVALIADAGHNLSDVLGLLLAWVGAVLARRQPSDQKTYGWRKTSIVAAFLNSASLLLVTGGIIWEAMLRLFHPGEVEGMIVIWVAAIGIVINTGTALMFLSGRKGDINIRAAFSHMMADAVVSAGVVLAGIGIVLTHWLWLDPVLSLLISVLIVFNAWGLLKESFHLIVDGVPAKIDGNAVRAYLSECVGVAQIHDLHIWGMSTTETALTVHLVMPDGHPGDAFLARICRELRHNFHIDHATLQVELGDPNHPCVLESKEQV